MPLMYMKPCGDGNPNHQRGLQEVVGDIEQHGLDRAPFFDAVFLLVSVCFPMKRKLCLLSEMMEDMW